MARLVVYVLLVVLALTLVGGLINGKPEAFPSKTQGYNPASGPVATPKGETALAGSDQTSAAGNTSPEPAARQTDPLDQILTGGANFLAGLHGLVKSLLEMVGSTPSNLNSFWGAVELLVIVLLTAGFLHLAWEKAVGKGSQMN